MATECLTRAPIDGPEAMPGTNNFTGRDWQLISGRGREDRVGLACLQSTAKSHAGSVRDFIVQARGGQSGVRNNL